MNHINFLFSVAR